MSRPEKAASVVWSPDFDRYASGEIPASAVRCVLCEHAPCDCPPPGSPEYWALTEKRHARKDRRR